jgi:cytochrome c oxidase assembly protein subunit 15
MNAHRNEAPREIADILAIGFGTSVAAWGAGYVCRLPAVTAPSVVVLALVIACFLGGGFVAGKATARGIAGGALAGLLAGFVNLLVLGSLLGGSRPNEVAPSALLWLPGSILATAALGAIGAAAGARTRKREEAPRDWTAAFAGVAAAATFLLVIVGGVVTSARAGLSVVDWPNSFGYGMFLYPLSRMTGGIYYEHAHRLFGSLVGLTTLVLAVHLHRVEARRWVRRLALAATAMVVLQGVLGGLRVTGKFTLSQDPSGTVPSLGLAVVHGALGQIFFATMVVLAAALAPSFKDPRGPRSAGHAATDRRLAPAVVGLLIVQIVLGAIQRHLAHGLMIHISMAAVVAPVAIAGGLRAWGLNREDPLLRRPGAFLAVLAGCQLLLGLGAYAAIGAAEAGLLAEPARLAIATAHQAAGALLLGTAALLAIRTYRRLAPGV